MLDQDFSRKRLRYREGHEVFKGPFHVHEAEPGTASAYFLRGGDGEAEGETGCPRRYGWATHVQLKFHLCILLAFPSLTRMLLCLSFCFGHPCVHDCEPPSSHTSSKLNRQATPTDSSTTKCTASSGHRAVLSVPGSRYDFDTVLESIQCRHVLITRGGHL